MKHPRSALALIAAAGFLAACGKQSDPAAAQAAAPSLPVQTADRITLPAGSPKLSRIRVQPVPQGSVPVDEVTSPGKVEANPNRISRVMLPVGGRVVSVEVRIGQYVKQGATVLTLESPDVDAAISAYIQAQAATAQSRSAVAKAQADLDRERDLLEHNAVAKKEVLNAEAILAQANSSLEQSKASVEQSLRRLQILGVKPGEFGQRMAVHAPIAGKVLEMTVAQGEYRNDTSVPVMTIADLSSVWVTSDVAESAIRFIKIGESLDIEFSAYPDEKFRGRVTQIADLVDPTTRTVKVRAELPNPGGRLRPEMFARISHTDATEMRPVVPAAAVVQDEGKTFVWRETAPGEFKRTAVELGTRTGRMVAIRQGLSAGDRIVIDGVMLLRAN